MNNPPPDNPDPLADGLPEGPERDELLDFARRLEAARPELSEAALRRVRDAMRAEMRRAGRRRRVWAVSAALATAAAVLVAVGLWQFAFRPDGRPDQPPDVASVQPDEPRPEAAPVEDRYRVKLAVPDDSSPGGRPLLATEEYGSLIGEMN